MSIAHRTNYNALSLGSNLDPLWWYNGSPSGAKHTGGSATIEIATDPLGGSFQVQRHIVHNGDILFGGDRCEVLSSQIGSAGGSRRYQFGFYLYLPPDFESSSSGWNSLWDFHYPNDGPAQSPITASIRSNNQLWMRVLGGPLTSDGTMGSIRNEEQIATLTRGVWNLLCFDIYEDITSGIVDAWVNGNQVWDKSIPTISPGSNTTYIKLGFYRAPSTGSTEYYYFQDFFYWENQSPNEMLAWFGTTADVTAPTVPTNLAATSTVPTEVDLSWTASTDAIGVQGYQVWRNGLLLNAVVSPTVSYSDTSVTAGTTYSYTVRSYDAAGNFSAQTAAVQVTTPSGSSSYDELPAGWMGGTYAYTGTTAHGSQADKQRCYKVTATRTGSVTHIGHYREPAATAGTETIKLAVWPDNGSGTEPGSGALKGQTAEISFTQASALGRYSTALTAPFAITSGDVVWVGELNGGQGNIAYVRKNTVAGVFRLLPQPYASGLTTWDTAADATYDLDMTIWLEGTESPPATPPVYVDSFVTGTELTVFYDKTLAAVAPLGADYAVTVDAAARQVTTVSVSGQVVTLTLASPVSSGQTVELSYTRVTGRELQDSDANLCANLTTEAVTNNTPAPFPARVTTTARVVASGHTGDGIRVVGGLGGGV